MIYRMRSPNDGRRENVPTDAAGFDIRDPKVATTAEQYAVQQAV
jgi:hypothetical protein